MKRVSSKRKARLLEYKKMRGLAMARDNGRCIYPGPPGFRCGRKAIGGVHHLTGRTVSNKPDFGDPSHPKNLASLCLPCHDRRTFENDRDTMLYLKRRFNYDYSERRYFRYHLDID